MSLPWSQSPEATYRAKYGPGGTHANPPPKANTCPYCGGRCDLSWTCFGPRTTDPDENTCAEMARHRRAVRAALDELED